MDRYTILLNVRGTQSQGEQEDTMELMTEGVLTRENEKYIIEYEESELSGMENTRTRVIVEDGRVSLHRLGSLRTSFEFAEHQRYEAMYETPYGSMQMAVMPTQIQSNVSEREGHIDLEYVIQMGGQSALNRLNIDYRTKN